MAITEAEFRTYCDDALQKLNRALDAVIEEHDVEVTFQNNVLSIAVEEPNPGKIVISPQGPTRQIWISAQSTSFKLDWNGAAFVHPSSGETLNQLIARFLRELLNVENVPL